MLVHLDFWTSESLHFIFSQTKCVVHDVGKSWKVQSTFKDKHMWSSTEIVRASRLGVTVRLVGEPLFAASLVSDV